MKKTETFHSIGKYLEAFNNWNNALTRVSANGTEVMVKGKWYSKEEFDTHNPKPVFEPMPRRDLNGVPTERLFSRY